MVYHGKIKDGVVVFDGALPNEGAEVRVEVVEPKAKSTLGEALLKIAGTAKGLPSDLARNHDHYLHGQPKK